MLIDGDETANEILVRCMDLLAEGLEEWTLPADQFSTFGLVCEVMNGVNWREEIDILDTYGRKGRLSEPEVDLEVDWCDLRSQLACNALEAEITHRRSK